MAKRLYISADYDNEDGDQDVLNILRGWNESLKHSLEFTDMAQVASGSVANNSDCRICQLKKEFNTQINLSSHVLFIVGDKTASRKAGTYCERARKEQRECFCTPYRENSRGLKNCHISFTFPSTSDGDVGYINNYSYLKHEFKQAARKEKNIIIFYNSLRRESEWLPDYMAGFENIAEPFWTKDANGRKVGNYNLLKQLLGL